MDAIHQLDIRRRHANLEAHIQAQLPFRLLADFENVLSPRHVDGHRLFAIHMLTRLHRGLQMLHVEVGRRGDHHRVNFLRSRISWYACGPRKVFWMPGWPFAEES